MFRRLILALSAATSALALGAGPAAAQDLEGVRTPSGNIYCMAWPAQDGEPAGLRCDIRETSNRLPPRPADCEEDWGDAFGLTPSGRGHRLCHGDTVANDAYPVLGYGRSWTRYGMTCVSRTTGLTCSNRQGHGFALSRAAQSVF